MTADITEVLDALALVLRGVTIEDPMRIQPENVYDPRHSARSGIQRMSWWIAPAPGAPELYPAEQYGLAIDWDCQFTMLPPDIEEDVRRLAALQYWQATVKAFVEPMTTRLPDAQGQPTVDILSLRDPGQAPIGVVEVGGREWIAVTIRVRTVQTFTFS